MRIKICMYISCDFRSLYSEWWVITW